MALFGFGKKKEEETRLEQIKKNKEEKEVAKSIDTIKENVERKQQEVESRLAKMAEVRKHFEAHPGMLVADYGALSVDDDTHLRQFLRENGLVVRVFMNDLAKEAVSTTDFSSAASVYKSSSLLTVFADTEEQIEAIAKYIKEKEIEVAVKFSKLGEKNGIYEEVLERV